MRIQCCDNDSEGGLTSASIYIKQQSKGDFVHRYTQKKVTTTNLKMNMMRVLQEHSKNFH